MKKTRIYVTSLVMPRMYETPLMMLRIYVTTLVMPRSWTHQVMVLGQQLNEFQEYVTILRGEMTACPPREMSVYVSIQRGEMSACPPREMIVLMLDSTVRIKQDSYLGVHTMKEEDLSLLSLFFSVPPM